MSMDTSPASDLTVEQFSDWLVDANVGDDVVYFTGSTVNGNPVRAAAYNAALGGLVFLYQKRVRWGVFAYHARRVDLSTGRLIKPSGVYVG